MTTILQVKERIFLNKYVIKRIGLAIVTLVIISLITFFAMNAIPGGPFDTEKATSPEVKAVLEKRYNLDKPIVEQYFIYMGNLLHGDWGVVSRPDVISGRQCPPVFQSVRSLVAWRFSYPLFSVLYSEVSQP